ncbi:hypothetical protein TNCV_4925851 [Trichonephila clavipes]|nr:hypothetical protein TNCV_4925851 [Trichonephila clavipes]
MNKLRKRPAGLGCSTVLSEELIALCDGNMSSTTIIVDRNILEFVQSSKNFMDGDSDDESEVNNAASVPVSNELRNVMKSKRSYLDAHYKGEMNNRMDIE